jgi:hypothetical protein
MLDAERKEALRDLTELYSAGDYQSAVFSMPKFISDEKGTDFDVFFDFLQNVYFLRAEYENMEDFEVKEMALALLSQAKEYGYPTNQIEVFINETQNT